MKKAIYEFDIPNFTVGEGYVTLVVTNGQAEIDTGNPDLVALAERHGGKPAPKPKPEKTTKSKKEEK